MEAVIKDGKLIITIEAVTKNPPQSKTGKSLVIASTHGNVPSTAVIDGKPLIVSVNAYVKA